VILAAAPDMPKTRHVMLMLVGTLICLVARPMARAETPPTSQGGVATSADGKAASAGEVARVDGAARKNTAKVRVILPPDKATNVDPRLARIVLLATEPLSEAPLGTLIVETRQGDAWVATSHKARSDYDPKTRQWRWILSPAAFPEEAEVRLTLKAQGGKTAAGQALPPLALAWTFTTMSASAARLQTLGKGGCPVESTSPSAPLPAPCPPSKP